MFSNIKRFNDGRNFSFFSLSPSTQYVPVTNPGINAVFCPKCFFPSQCPVSSTHSPELCRNVTSTARLSLATQLKTVLVGFTLREPCTFPAGMAYLSLLARSLRVEICLFSLLLLTRSATESSIVIH